MDLLEYFYKNRKRQTDILISVFLDDIHASGTSRYSFYHIRSAHEQIVKRALIVLGYDSPRVRSSVISSGKKKLSESFVKQALDLANLKRGDVYCMRFSEKDLSNWPLLQNLFANKNTISERFTVETAGPSCFLYAINPDTGKYFLLFDKYRYVELDKHGYLNPGRNHYQLTVEPVEGSLVFASPFKLHYSRRHIENFNKLIELGLLKHVDTILPKHFNSSCKEMVKLIEVDNENEVYFDSPSLDFTITK